MSIFNKPQQKPMPTFSTSQTVLPSAAISRIESGSLAELNVPNLMLKKGEKCCFVDKSYEMVETTTDTFITYNVKYTHQNFIKCPNIRSLYLWIKTPAKNNQE